MYYDEVLLANHSDASTIDHQVVGAVNYLASNDYLADMDNNRTVCAISQRYMTDAA